MGRKKNRPSLQIRPLTKKQKAIVLPVMVAVVGVAVTLAILAIILTPSNDTSQRGVAANGFTAYGEKGTTLNVDKVITKDAVVSALGSKAKSVETVDVSSVFNYNGTRSQTVTYPFKRADGKTATIYVDLTQFQSSKAMDNEQIFTDTKLARIINGHSAYYMHAQTLSSAREYRLLVVNGLKAYKFVIDQPVDDITISEVSAMASLIKLAQKAKL